MAITLGEFLLDVSDSLTSRGVVEVCVDHLGTEEVSTNLARIRTALDLARSPAVVRLRSVGEEWDMVRVNRELY